MLALANDPAGEAMASEAIKRHFNAPPWYLIGPFVAAMMREDTKAAGVALARLRVMDHSMGTAAILAAAYEARTKNMAGAHDAWEEAQETQPFLQMMPDVVLDRFPFAPEVRKKLREWLGPILE